MRVAVAGTPNSGKTTLFNSLTGSSARVGNYPGITVERREGSTTLPDGRRVAVIDLPGCYSLVARSAEEEVAHSVLTGVLEQDPPELIVCVVDAANLARGLYLTTQLAELGRPLVVALNMIDVAEQQGIDIDVHRLAALLGAPVVPTVARAQRGLSQLVLTLAAALKSNGHNNDSGGRAAIWRTLEPTAREELTALEGELATLDRRHPLGTLLWLVTSNPDRLPYHVGDPRREAVDRTRGRLDGAAPGSFGRRLIEARYRQIDELLTNVLHTPTMRHDDLTERIDRVLLHPLWGFVVFGVTMFVLLQLVFVWAEPLMGGVEWSMARLAAAVTAIVPTGLTQSLLVNGVIAGVGNILAFLPQIALLFLGITVLEESGYMARAAFLLDRIMRTVGLHGKAFIPLMGSFACAVPGVMAARTIETSRDRLVTILIAPLMSCSARLPIYVMVIAAVFSATPPLLGFLSLGGLIIAAMYLLGFVAAISTAWLLKHTVLRSPLPPLLMEMPSYKQPVLRSVLLTVYERSKVFVVQTGSIILALSLVLWALLTFPMAPTAVPTPTSEGPAATLTATVGSDAPVRAMRQLEYSIAGRIGHAVEPLIAPLGFDWRIGIGLVASFAAREVLVSTLGQVYALDADVEPDSPALRDALLADIDPQTGRPRFTPLVGLSLMVFFVLAMQCLSTLSTVKRETNSWRWPLAQLAYMNTLAYAASWIIYQGGHALGLG
ncbi:MAG: ferrous iron transport protein B [Myxococcota bacterium]